ncbi:MAG: hypothetical protein HQK67_07635 [Desulfamplus sp.]|nr:hypothetical protein [Desulfamplus sp.]
MSKQYPECPLYNHVTCKDLHNPNMCAIIREDKNCFKKRPKNKQPDNDNKQPDDDNKQPDNDNKQPDDDNKQPDDDIDDRPDFQTQ